ncbi:MAG: peptidase domain-containing ABC transporter [Alphaproteobacteria bacterium]
MTRAATAAATLIEEPGHGLDRALRDGGHGFHAISEAAACLRPLLATLNWHGEARQIAEALPHFADDLDLHGLRKVLANLNYATRPARAALDSIDPRLIPCLFAPDEGPLMVVTGLEGGTPIVFDGASGTIRKIADRRKRGTAYFISKTEPEVVARQMIAEDWLSNVAARFRGGIIQLMVITFVTSVLGLAVPLFIMAVYDLAITAGSLHSLYFLAAGIAIALVGDFILRLIRARLLAYIGARLDIIVGNAAFQQILHLPVAMTERATIGAQVSRLRQFETLREFFTSPLATVFLEVPFVVVFIAVIALIGGPLAWIPVLMIALMAIVAAILAPAVRRGIGASSQAMSRRQNFLIEMVAKIRGIKTYAAERVWSERHREHSAQAARASFKASQISILIQSTAQQLMLAAGLAALGFGALRVLDGSMTVGGLIACMALTWRVLSPLHTGFLSLTRLEHVRLGLRQVNQLMGLKRELEPGKAGVHYRTFKGHVAFDRVSLRYLADARPALLGVSRVIEPGQVVAITGASGAGKSTMLKLVAGLYQPQTGAVFIDDIDIRQLDPGELRRAIAYVPQTIHLFHGTVAQNLRLANPTATDAELAAAAASANVLDDIRALPEGFETRLTNEMQGHLPNDFRQRLALTQAYVKEARIYLLDQPANTLDAAGEAAFRDRLLALKGRATIIMTTHRPSHAKLADQVLVLREGVLAAAGPPEEILTRSGRAAR